MSDKIDQLNLCEVEVLFGDQSCTLRVPVGTRLMQAMKQAGLPVASDCGGACTCATCHVYVDSESMAKLPRPKANELALLQVVDEPTPFSRLSCQIEINYEANDIKVRIAPS